MSDKDSLSQFLMCSRNYEYKDCFGKLTLLSYLNITLLATL